MSNTNPFNLPANNLPKKSFPGRQTPIEEALKIDEEGMTTAKALYEFLGLAPSQFSRWCKSSLENNVFAVGGTDYLRLDIDVETPTGGIIQRTDYRITADLAKKLAMVSNSPRGEQARDYFIMVEQNAKALANAQCNSVPAPPSHSELALMLSETAAKWALALQEKERLEILAAHQELEIYEQQEYIGEMEPKVEAFDKFISEEGLFTIQEAASELDIPGLGQKKLFKFLREEKVLMDDNLPYRQYIDSGYFKVRSKEFIDGRGETRISMTSRVTKEGLDYLHRKIKKHMLKSGIRKF